MAALCPPELTKTNFAGCRKEPRLFLLTGNNITEDKAAIEACNKAMNTFFFIQVFNIYFSEQTGWAHCQ